MARSSWIPGPRAASFSSIFALALAWLVLTHWPFLDLPYHWDELGFFVPAAHDLFAEGRLIPRSTPPEIHPPLVMVWLAVAWKLFGFSPQVTRLAMLVAGAAVVAAVWLLARRVAGPRAAGMAAALAAVSPPVVAQSMLAHLDLPATLWVLLTLYWYLEERWWLCTAAATALVLTKETGLFVPLLLAALDRRRAWILGPPAMALAAWTLHLRDATGYWLGNPEFARYNVEQAARWARLPLTLLRRLYQLGIANFHWIGVLVLCRARRWSREEHILLAIAAGYVALHSVLGGAVLLRYLLPALAVFYILIAPRLPRPALVALAAGLALSNWWNPPYPFGYEDNLAVVDFVRLHQAAARWLAERHPDRTVTTAWPLTDELSNPLSGYVTRPLRVRPVENFEPRSWDPVAEPDLVVLYSRSWEPALTPWLARYFDYTPQISREELMRRFGLASLARWERRGQWIEVFGAEARSSAEAP